MTKTIDPQHAADLADSDDGDASGPWVRVTDQRLAGRSRMLVVLDPTVGASHEYWGLRYREGDYPWDTTSDAPLPLVRLYPHEVTMTVYRSGRPS